MFLASSSMVRYTQTQERYIMQRERETMESRRGEHYSGKEGFLSEWRQMMPPPDWLLKSSGKQRKQRTGTGIALNQGYLRGHRSALCYSEVYLI